MGEGTGIAWTSATWNPFIGCVRVSPGCGSGGKGGCYAERLARDRMKLDVWGPASTTQRHRTAPSTWANVRKWNRAAENAGVPMRVFVGSMMDWAEDHPQLDPWREEMWALIRESTWLRFQMLTKRADRIAKCLPPDWGDGYKHVWLGVSVEDQEWADKRIPHLLSVPAAVRFISYEPALGPLDLERYLWGAVSDTAGYFDRNGKERSGGIGGQTMTARPRNLLHWVIQGGESGPGHRPMDHAWARAVRDQCKAAGCAYFFKQSAAYRTEMGTALEEADGSRWVWKQYPGDLKPPERVE